MIAEKLGIDLSRISITDRESLLTEIYQSLLNERRDETMQTENRLEIALRFIGLHKNDDLDDWVPEVPDRDQKLLTIYNNLINDVYGNVQELDGSYEIVIAGNESITGHDEMFSF